MCQKIFHRCWPSLGLLLAVSIGTLQAAANTGVGFAETLPGHIVVFQENADVDSYSRNLAAAYGLQVSMQYRHALKGMAAFIPPGLLKRLEQDPRVAYIEPVQAMHLYAQTLPIGIDRINVELNTTANIDNIDDGVDVDIAIIDTGIDIDHPDLNIYRYVYCYPKNPRNGTCDENDVRADDSNGHGTHVAGIAAARDNNTGVVGVAPGARIWGIRVMQQDGSLTTLEVIAALDYVVANAIQIEVANMSLGFTGSSSALDTALANTVAAGVTIAVAAGNEALDVSQTSPGGHPDVITVSALADFDGKPDGLLNQGFTYSEADCTENQDDSFACFSNFGSGVDIMAPGTKIKSTNLNGGTAILHGTSMSSPHVAGAAAIYLVSNPGASPATVKAALIAGGDATPCDTPSGYCTDDPDGIYEPMVLLAPFPEPDGDGDGIPDEQDNCPMDANAGQLDTDGDDEGDACDADDDNDGTPDTIDAFPLNPNEDTDTDSDGVGNNADIDDDGDGYSDVLEVTVGTDPLDDNSTFLDVAGDINGDGHINAGDLVLGVRILTGLHIATAPEHARFDIGPLSGGLPMPDGSSNAGDYLVLQRLVSGSISF
jgi:subtilisin family serine protease